MCVSYLAAQKILKWDHSSLGRKAKLTPIKHPMPKNKPFTIKKAQRFIACLLKYKQDFESQLNDLYAKSCIAMEKNEVQIIPCEGNECVKDWQSRCWDVVDGFFKGLEEEEFVFLPIKKDLMDPFINEAKQKESSVHIHYIEDRWTVYITGKPSEVDKVKNKLQDFCESLTNEKFILPINIDKKKIMLTVINEAIQCEQSLHIKFTEGESVVSITGERSEVTRVKGKFESIRDSLITESFDVPVNKKNLMDPFIKTIQDKQLLCIKYEEDMSKVFITGVPSEVTRVKSELKDHCEMIVVDKKIPVANKMFYILLVRVLLQNLLIEHPNVDAILDQDDSNISITGLMDYCEQFKTNLLELNSTFQCVPVSLSSPFNRFISTETGRRVLDNCAGEFLLQSTVCYIDEDSKLFILGSSKNQAAIDALAHKIQSSLSFFSIPYSMKFHKCLQSPAWINLSNKLMEGQPVQINYAPNKIEVVGDLRMCKFARDEITNFIEHHDVAMRKIPLHCGEWRLIKLHLNKEWCKLERKFKKLGRMELIMPNSCDDNPSIIIEADERICKIVEEEIKKVLSRIVFSSMPKEKRLSVVNYFYSEAGKSALHQIETDEQAYVHINQLEADATAVVTKDGTDSSDSPGLKMKCNKMCSGFTGNMKVSLYHGDITALPIDVMVNATNLQLKHTNGVAEAIAKAGGPSIQSSSDAYLKDVGNLKVGDAIMMQEVGNLSCQRLIHVISPSWDDHNNLSLLSQACTNALQKASQFQSISFPAVGCGSPYDFPIIQCARIMIETVIKYSQGIPSPPITEVSFVVLNQREVDYFYKIMNRLLTKVTCTPTMLKQLSDAVTSTPEATRRSDSGIIEVEHNDFLVIDIKNQKSYNYTGSTTHGIDTKNTALNFIPVQDNQEQYIELLNGELLQHSVSYSNYLWAFFITYMYHYAGRYICQLSWN